MIRDGENSPWKLTQEIAPRMAGMPRQTTASPDLAGGPSLARCQCMRIHAAVTACALGACTHNVYTPPTRAFPLETPSTVKAGKYGLQLEASGHGKSPDVGAGTVRVRRGIEDNLEASAEFTYAKAGNKLATDTSQQMFAGRAGVKLRPDETPFIAVTAGAGGGAFAGGPFLSADVGGMAAYEMCRFTPFIGGSAYVSQPLNAQAVDTTEDGMAPGTFVDTPETTVGVQVRVGVAVNLSSCEAHATSLVVGFGLDHFWDNDSDRGLASGGAALSLDFGD